MLCLNIRAKAVTHAGVVVRLSASQHTTHTHITVRKVHAGWSQPLQKATCLCRIMVPLHCAAFAALFASLRAQDKEVHSNMDTVNACSNWKKRILVKRSVTDLQQQNVQYECRGQTHHHHMRRHMHQNATLNVGVCRRSNLSAADQAGMCAQPSECVQRLSVVAWLSMATAKAQVYALVS